MHIRILSLKIQLIIFIILGLSFTSFSQEELGQATQFYGGVNQLNINPAGSYTSPYKFDAEIISANLFFDNSILYLNNTNLIKEISGSGNNADIVFRNSSRLNTQFSSGLLNTLNQYFLPKAASQTVTLEGLSVFVPWKKWHFGLINKVKMSTSILGLNNSLLNPLISYFDKNQLEGNKSAYTRLRFNTLIWRELGLNIGYQYKRVGYKYIEVGMTLKMLYGYGGAFANFNSNSMFGGTYNYSLKLGSSYPTGNQSLTAVGKGIGADFGISIEDKSSIEKSYNCPSFCTTEFKQLYNWKLGVSILDLGFISFSQALMNTGDHSCNGNVFSIKFWEVRKFTNGGVTKV